MRTVELLNRAHECRRLAAILRDPKMKQTYLMAADTWDTLARRAAAADRAEAQTAATASTARASNDDPGKPTAVAQDH